MQSSSNDASYLQKALDPKQPPKGYYRNSKLTHYRVMCDGIEEIEPDESNSPWPVQEHVPPPSPNDNINSMETDEYKSTLLVSGYIRKYCTLPVPADLVQLLFNWYYTRKYAITYEETVDLLMNHECCIGVYDFKMKAWRSAIYVNHFDKTKRIMIRYLPDSNVDFNYAVDKFKTLKNFPINYAVYDNERFKPTEKDLKDNSNVSYEKIDEWINRQKNKGNEK